MNEIFNNYKIGFDSCNEIGNIEERIKDTSRIQINQNQILEKIIPLLKKFDEKFEAFCQNQIDYENSTELISCMSSLTNFISNHQEQTIFDAFMVSHIPEKSLLILKDNFPFLEAPTLQLIANMTSFPQCQFDSFFIDNSIFPLLSSKIQESSPNIPEIIVIFGNLLSSLKTEQIDDFFCKIPIHEMLLEKVDWNTENPNFIQATIFFLIVTIKKTQKISDDDEKLISFLESVIINEHLTKSCFKNFCKLIRVIADLNIEIIEDLLFEDKTFFCDLFHTFLNFKEETTLPFLQLVMIIAKYLASLDDPNAKQYFLHNLLKDWSLNFFFTLLNENSSSEMKILTFYILSKLIYINPRLVDNSSDPFFNLSSYILTIASRECFSVQCGSLKFFKSSCKVATKEYLVFLLTHDFPKLLVSFIQTEDPKMIKNVFQIIQFMLNKIAFYGDELSQIFFSAFQNAQLVQTVDEISEIENKQAKEYVKRTMEVFQNHK